MLLSTFYIYILLGVTTSQALSVGKVENSNDIVGRADDIPDWQNSPEIAAVKPISSPFVMENAQTSVGAYGPGSQNLPNQINTEESQVAIPDDTAPLYGLFAVKPNIPDRGPPRFIPPAGIDLCKGFQAIYCCLMDLFSTLVGCVLWDNHLDSRRLCGTDDPNIYFACCDYKEDFVRPTSKDCTLAPGEKKRRKKFDGLAAQKAGEAAIKILTAPHPFTPLIEKLLTPQESGP